MRRKIEINYGRKKGWKEYKKKEDNAKGNKEGN
jgi:hypothetical protein